MACIEQAYINIIGPNNYSVITIINIGHSQCAEIK